MNRSAPPSSAARVLLVTDDEHHARHLCSSLGEHGIELVWKTEASAGITDDLAAFDVLMIEPPTDPADSPQAALLKSARAKGVWILFFSAHADLPGAASLVGTGALGYVSQETATERLRALIESGRDRRSAWKVLQERRRALSEEANLLETLEQAIRESPSPAMTHPLQAAVELLVSDLLSDLRDLRLLVRSVESVERREGRLDLALMMAALEEAVTVLHRTKQAFKSRDLADLRHRLEGVLSQVVSGKPSITTETRTSRRVESQD